MQLPTPEMILSLGRTAKETPNTMSTIRIGAVHKKLNNKRISKELFVLIIKELINEIKLQLIEGWQIKLPYRLGTLEIIEKQADFSKNKIDTRNLGVDWAKTKKLWKENPELESSKNVIYQDYEATGGIRFLLKWGSRSLLSYRFKILYNIKPVKAFRVEIFNARVLNNKMYRRHV